MKIGFVDFPPELLRTLRDGKLVVFAGTGVSMGMPANLPSFKGLSDEIAFGSGLVQGTKQTEDRFLGALQHQGANVHRETEKILTRVNERTGKPPAPTSLHCALLRLFPSMDRVRIVTTNFDMLFEEAAKEVFGMEVPQSNLYTAPVLPRGRDFHGIVHLHGIVGCPEEMILTDADFGRAYYGEGWARRFLIDLLQHQSVLYVGYSHNDASLYYLTRAFTVNGDMNQETSRWTLIQSNAESEIRDHWRMLGIHEILYPYPTPGDDPYEALPECVNDLSERATFTMERWEAIINELATKGPSNLNDEEVSVITWALRDASEKERLELMRFFTEAARDPEWLEWLDNLPTKNQEGKVLDPLFTNGRLDTHHKILSRWLAESFAINQTNPLLMLLGKHSLELNPAFCWDLARVLCDRDVEVEPSVLRKWTSILIRSYSKGQFPTVEHFLLEIARKLESFDRLDCILDIFEVFCESKISIKPPFRLPYNAQAYNVTDRVDVELKLLGGHHKLASLWDGGHSLQRPLKMRLDEIVDDLLPRMIQRLEERHRLWIMWDKANRDADSDSYRRSAIEPHEQDTHSNEAMDVIIDATRDCLEWMFKNKPTEAEAWRDRLADADSPLFRRLALYVLDIDTTISANLKLDWFLERFSPHDIAEHHEIYHLLYNIYPNLDNVRRQRVINATFEWTFKCDDTIQAEEITEYERFRLLSWLKSSFKDQSDTCSLINKPLAEIREKHPSWTISEHPDLTHYSTGVHYIGSISPYSADELLSKPPAEWLPELLEYHDPVPSSDVNREGLILELGVAVRRNFDWGQELAALLIEKGLWNTNLWNGLFQAWGWHEEASLEFEQFGRVLDVIENQVLWLPRHLHALSHLLYSLVKEHGKPYALELASRTHVLARELWKNLDHDQKESGNDNWVTDAINLPAGILAEYWIGSLSLWIQSQDPRPRELSGDFREAMTIIAKDPTINGRLGRAILVMQYRWLYYLDEQWTREHLLPYFSLGKNASPSDFVSVWDGFLMTAGLDVDCFSSLEDKILDAMPQIRNGGLLATKRDRFIEVATAAICFYVTENPLKRWTPALLNGLDDVERANFVRFISRHMETLNEAQQRDWWTRWLKVYWEKRINGIPAPPIGAKEASELLAWLPWLPAVFDEAVEVATRMNEVHSSVEEMMFSLKDRSGRYNQEYVQAHPIAFKKLCDYIDQFMANSYFLGPAELQQIKDWLRELGNAS